MKGACPMKKQILLWAIIFSLFLSGCTKEKQMNKLFAKIQTIEEEIHEAQEEIYRLDERESAIFEEITSFGNNDQQPIEQLVKEALHILEDKKQEMDLVIASFETAQARLADLEEIVSKGDIDIDQIRLMELIQKRYTYYEKMYDKQLTSINLHEDLYGAFLKEVNVNDIKKMLQVINDNGKMMEKHYEQANELTEEFNVLINKE